VFTELNAMLYEQFQSDNYNVVWNNGEAVGMSISPARLYLIPRFAYDTIMVKTSAII
jgi:diadenosine tetraphosphate (Ap4A) HIT family hydrolase